MISLKLASFPGLVNDSALSKSKLHLGGINIGPESIPGNGQRLSTGASSGAQA